MQEKQYTNEQLARDFLRVAAIQVTNFQYYLPLMYAIKKYMDNIQDLYKREGNLKNLTFSLSKKPTDQIKRFLELILEKGVEKVEKGIIEEKTSRARRSATSHYQQANSIRIKGTGWLEDDLNFDIAVKRYEGD